MTYQQTLLLRAALLEGSRAIEAWEAWRACTTIDALDADSQWLLPLLYDNLHRHGVPSGPLARYRNVYLHNWYKNNLMLRRAEKALRGGGNEGARVVLLGGAAMALGYYATLGARPFERPVVMIGTAARGPDGTGTDAGALEIRPTIFGPGCDEAARCRARPCQWKTMRWLVMDPRDQLAEICVRQEEWDSRSTLFQAADAGLLIARHSALDWSGAADLAKRSGAGEALTSLLVCLESQIGIAIPSSAWPAARPGSGASAVSRT